LSGGAVPEPDSSFLGLTRLVLSRSYRVATIDYEKDRIAERAITFARRVAARD